MPSFPDHLHLICAAAFCLYTSIAPAAEVAPKEDISGKAAAEAVSKSELVLEASAKYTDIDYNVPLTDKPIPVITSDNESEIYSKLIQGSLIPRYMVLEASVYPLASLGTAVKSHSPSLYRQAEIGNTGINLLESATPDFQEPWAVSAFFGNVAKLNRPKEQREGNNYGYTGYLFSAGNKHIKDNVLIPDDWYEVEWKIKGQLDYPDEKLSWSFRVGARYNTNKAVNDVTYVSLHRSNLDLRYSFLEWLENANYDMRMYFLQTGGEMVRLELIAGKKVPMPQWGYAPTLDVGFVWTSPNEYSGPLRNLRTNVTTLVFRPSIEF
ncbi:hypothetical protein GALL_210270 [mine drainage metagenome]|uniref:Uncharacterized protein n=1 Tax=mine drainage metagenome TaxID=410659 RepID=A0A1J5RL91_9ZZZZ